MNITEAIQQLEKIKTEVGDIELVTIEDTAGEGFIIEYNKIFDIIELPDETETVFTKVVTLLAPEDFEIIQPYLTVVKDEES